MDMYAKTAPPSPADRAVASARALAGTLQLARALAQMRRPIDLTGLDQQVGRLCAAALDLPPADGRAMRPLLATLLAELDALSVCVAAMGDDAT
jgi:hypothetical protein